MLGLSILVAILYAVGSFRAWRAERDTSPIRFAVPAALALHALVLAQQTWHGGSLQIGVGEAASLFAWQAALILWIFCLGAPLQGLGVAAYPLAAACVLWAASAPNQGQRIGDWTVGLHVLFSLLSAGLLTLAAIHALGLGILDRILHRPENLPLARRLPPLQTMERLLFQLIFAGFFLLSLTLLSGLLLNHEQRSQPQTMIVLSLLAWLVFGILIFGRLRYGWRARTATQWMLAGYATLVAAYFGSKLLLSA